MATLQIPQKLFASLLSQRCTRPALGSFAHQPSPHSASGIGRCLDRPVHIHSIPTIILEMPAMQTMVLRLHEAESSKPHSEGLVRSILDKALRPVWIAKVRGFGGRNTSAANIRGVGDKGAAVGDQGKEAGPALNPRRDSRLSSP